MNRLQLPAKPSDIKVPWQCHVDLRTLKNYIKRLKPESKGILQIVHIY